MALVPNYVTEETTLIFPHFTDWTTLFFQNTQGLSALEAALRCLPMVFVGIVTNIAAGLLVDKVSAGVLVSVGGLVSAGMYNLDHSLRHT